MTSNAKRDALANEICINPEFDTEDKLMSDVLQANRIWGFEQGYNFRDAEVAELRAQVEFCKMYYKPDDTSFKTMIETFVELSDEQKDALIELTKALLKTKDAK